MFCLTPHRQIKQNLPQANEQYYIQYRGNIKHRVIRRCIHATRLKEHEMNVDINSSAKACK